MEIILKQDIANLGHKDDIVKVKNGYAVNYLIPQGMAILATESAKKVLAEPRYVRRPALSQPRSTALPSRWQPR